MAYSVNFANYTIGETAYEAVACRFFKEVETVKIPVFPVYY